MNEDFNPFDLSAVPKKPEEEKPVEVPLAKPTVNRVSMGPIFHSRIIKIIALLLGIVLASLIGFSATSYYLNQKTVTKQQNITIHG